MWNIIKIILIVLVVLIVVALALVIFTSKANKIKHKSNPINFKSKTDSTNNALLVYQPGRTSYAKDISMSIGENLSELGYDVLMNTAGDYLTNDLNNYDVIVFASPIYAGMHSEVIREYIQSIQKWGNGKVIFYCIGANSSTEEFNGVKEIFEKNKLDGLYKIHAKEDNEQIKKTLLQSIK